MTSKEFIDNIRELQNLAMRINPDMWGVACLKRGVTQKKRRRDSTSTSRP